MTSVRSLVIGTAGHIDHGKSSLVRALTGTDPDRLQEEKERGITIELGFAFMDLSEGRQAMFVDVPGHERFVRNMLAGASGIDAALLVVAADESVMPQTREHLDILRLLQIPRGICVLTKVDLVDAEMLELVEMEVRELFSGTFLESAPVLAVDSITGRGLEELKEAIQHLADEAPASDDRRVFRLPVDRVFALRGFGTVVTGTSSGDALCVGDQVTLQTSGRRSRVRSIQVAGESRPSAVGGQRTALNLPDLQVADIERGDVVGRTDELAPTSTLLVRLDVLPSCPAPIKPRARVHLHLGSAEVLARVRPLDVEGEVEAGTSCLARLSLESPLTAVWGDRFVLRRYSPVITIAGGRVLLPQPLPSRARGARLRELVASLDSADVVEAGRIWIEQKGEQGAELAELVPLLGHPQPVLKEILDPEAGAGRVVVTDTGRYLDPATLEQLQASLKKSVGEHHQRSPLDPGLSREDARQSLLPHAPADVFRSVVTGLVDVGELVEEDDVLRAPEFRVAASPEDEQNLQRLEAALEAAGIHPPAVADLFKELSIPTPVGGSLLSLLVRRGTVRRIGGGLHLHRDVLDGLVSVVRRHGEQHPRISVAEFKDLVGATRKYAIPLLEHLDYLKVTIRDGDVRRIVQPRSD